MNELWRATRDWEGEIGFIVAGGPSVATQNLELLRGRKVIAVNCAHEIVPWAEFLIFADARFYHHYQKQILAFKGNVICCSTTVRGTNVKRMHRKSTSGLSADAGTVMVKLTTLTAAINLAVLLGARALVLLGADGKKDANGKTHHHADHPWRQLNDCWNKQKVDLKAVAVDLKKLEIPCINASPDSAWADLWPVMELPEAIHSLSADISESETTSTNAPLFVNSCAAEISVPSG